MATETDKVNSSALATLVAVGAFATLAVALGVDALVRYETAELSAERASHASEPYRSLAAEQSAKLTAQPKWSDQSKGLVSMPITQAMGHVVADLVKDPLSASPLPPPDAGTQTAINPDAGTPVEPGSAEAPDGGEAPAPTGSAAPPASATPAGAGTAPAPKAPAPKTPTTGSPKPSTVLAVPPAPPAPRPQAPAPAAPKPSDG